MKKGQIVKGGIETWQKAKGTRGCTGKETARHRGSVGNYSMWQTGGTLSCEHSRAEHQTQQKAE